MKNQIERFSPHQNGKVFAVLMAITSLVFLIPFALFASAAMPPDRGPSLFVLILLPLFYLVFTYLSIAAGCWFYNVMYKYIGGIEFESKPVDAGFHG